MAQRQVSDGLRMLQALMADDAFVWGSVSAVPMKAQRSSHRAGPGVQKLTVMTDQALRQAVIHLRQAVPTQLDISEAHSLYMAALHAVFASKGSGEGDNVATMVSAHLPQQLSDRFVGAVRKIRECLGARRTGTPRRGSQCAAACQPMHFLAVPPPVSHPGLLAVTLNSFY